VKDSVKLDARDYDLTLEGKGQFIHVDSLIQITALEQSLTLTIQAKKAPQTRRRVKLQADPNPHFFEFNFFCFCYLNCYAGVYETKLGSKMQVNN
jgi:hypothetical protein